MNELSDISDADTTAWLIQGGCLLFILVFFDVVDSTDRSGHRWKNEYTSSRFNRSQGSKDIDSDKSECAFAKLLRWIRRQRELGNIVDKGNAEIPLVAELYKYRTKWSHRTNFQAFKYYTYYAKRKFPNFQKVSKTAKGVRKDTGLYYNILKMIKKSSWKYTNLLRCMTWTNTRRTITCSNW